VLKIAVRAGRADLVTPLVEGDAAREALLQRYLRSQAPVKGQGG
jgi:hypothetical protein